MTATVQRSDARGSLGISALPGGTEAVLVRISDAARDVDQGGISPWEALRDLAPLGGLDAGLPVQIEIVHAIARRCVASAFSLWGHRTGIEFHDALGAERPAGAADGATVLASGMAPAFKAEAGLGEIPLRITAGPEGLRVDGTLPWCSNLRDGARVVLPALTDDGSRRIVRIGLDAPGVRIKRLTGLVALNSTDSGVLTLEHAPVEDVLTDDVPGFLDRVRPAFLQLQTAMCLGLSGAALDAARAAADGVALSVLGDEFAAAEASWERLARSLRADRALSARELVRSRLDAALLAGRATALEQKVVGGRGFAVASATSRRGREATFLPVQSPTEIHLRHLLGQPGEGP